MDSQSWFWLALGFGALLVLGTSLEKFGEPTYASSDDQPYTKIRPRFVTSNDRFLLSQILYVVLMEIIYLGIALYPNHEELGRLLGANDFEGNLGYPLFAATIVIGGQNAKYINRIEHWFRSWCHRWAKIPGGARETIKSLRRATFDYAITPDPNRFIFVQDLSPDEDTEIAVLENWVETLKR